MIKAIESLVTGEQVIVWLVIFFLVIYFLYKEGPEFVKRITDPRMKASKMEETDKHILTRLDKIEARLDGVDQKLNNDWTRLNVVEKATKESLQERTILVKAMLSVIDGLQQLGANGKTHEAEKELTEYLNEQAHK